MRLWRASAGGQDRAYRNSFGSWALAASGWRVIMQAATRRNLAFLALGLVFLLLLWQVRGRREQGRAQAA